MKNNDLRGKIPLKGFIKISDHRVTSLSSSQRIALIRKGNEFFNAGQFEQAKRIFMTTGYSDGLIRLGDQYYEKKDPYEALRMYWLAPSVAKRDKVIEQMASVIHKWLKEG